jgi:hypothetical protein
MLEWDEETRDTTANIRQLQNRIDQHDEEYPMISFNTKDTSDSIASGSSLDRDVDDRGAGGCAGGVSATDCGARRTRL